MSDAHIYNIVTKSGKSQVVKVRRKDPNTYRAYWDDAHIDINQFPGMLNDEVLRQACGRMGEELLSWKFVGRGALPQPDVIVPDLSEFNGQFVTPEMLAEIRRRVEAAGLVYGGDLFADAEAPSEDQHE